MVLTRRKLGDSDLEVTNVCLGTMTWGIQNSEEEAHQQLDFAIKDRGVNFIDTAEFYPVPSSAPGWKPGTTERYIGTWLEKNQSLRSSLIIATKIAGFSPKSAVAVARTPERYADTAPNAYPDCRLDAESVVTACEASLARLQTTYIDLYQLHWPDRFVPLWGGRNYEPANERDAVEFADTLRGIQTLIEQGKIRYWGLSNETTYGVAEWVHTADRLGVPRPITIQNQFSMLNRTFEGELAEACAPSHYNIGLLPWSILGGGVLSGKYLDKVDLETKWIDPTVASCRLALFPAFQPRFLSKRVLDQVRKYNSIAQEAGVSLATLAQAFCKSRWYVASSIIGATTLEQLKENIDSFEIDLSAETLMAIDGVHNDCLDPSVYVA